MMSISSTLEVGGLGRNENMDNLCSLNVTTAFGVLCLIVPMKLVCLRPYSDT